MELTIKSKNITLANQVRVADKFATKLVGWIGKKTIHDGEALLIRPCNSIHTFFMKVKIDVLFLNKQNKIVSIKEKMKPYSISHVISEAYIVIECKSGTISKYNIEIGDIVSVV
ncbi:DUF192 domain-containing protein [Paenibacillus oryzisoli]|uniref:DUF192 domain-containing protein n=1 Tax=Paenibacillus oryzisoli TaxID=1850517 RepID=A0A198A4G0_9BACL|nr:DUF192 domain-containing protein [Paenibacillus oryzisoli]OAS16035.1 hypothetical protein A8708_05505 [Paenibacillus oryzisoli]